MNPAHGIDETGKGTGIVQKTGSFLFDKLGNASDVRSEHQFLVRHGFHQNHRHTLALAGHDYEIGVLVIARKLGAGHVADKVNAALETQLHDLALEGAALGAVADDPAEEIESFGPEHGASLDEKAIVLDAVQASNRK